MSRADEGELEIWAVEDFSPDRVRCFFSGEERHAYVFSHAGDAHGRTILHVDKSVCVVDDVMCNGCVHEVCCVIRVVLSANHGSESDDVGLGDWQVCVFSFLMCDWRSCMSVYCCVRVCACEVSDDFVTVFVRNGWGIGDVEQESFAVGVAGGVCCCRALVEDA